MAKDKIIERHRHRYEVNNEYIPRLEQAGLRVSAVSAGEGLCEMVELPEAEHPWFVACQFHPEFTSTPKAGIRCSRHLSRQLPVLRINALQLWLALKQCHPVN